MNKIIYFYLVLIIGVSKDLKVVGGGRECDESRSPTLQAGELGLLGAFPWLGLLRVHLHEINKTALSGVVLVSDRHAIGYAEDIAKIPMNIFREDSDVFFIPETELMLVYPLLDYLTHPDYDSHVSTIALVELDLRGRDQLPFSAVCWPQVAINSQELYTVGYSDALDDILYGKMILKSQNVDRKTCRGHYSNIGASGLGFQFQHFMCASAVDPDEGCNWETGMALVSNSTGVWTLLGLSAQGPDCRQPGRFLDFAYYQDWINEALDPTIREPGYRRSGYGVGFQKNKNKEIQDVSISETFVSNPNARRADKVYGSSVRDLGLTVWDYPFRDPESHFNLQIDRVDKDAINISVFDGTYEKEVGACHRYNHLLYRDETKIVAGQHGTASYRLTLYDLLLNNITCVQVWTKSATQSPVKLWWTKFLDKGEGTSFGSSANTPEQMLKIIPQKPMYQPTKDPTRYDPKLFYHLEPQSIRDRFDTVNVNNVNLLVTLKFKGKASLFVKVYGQPTPPAVITTSTAKPVIVATKAYDAAIFGDSTERYSSARYLLDNFVYHLHLDSFNFPRRRHFYPKKNPYEIPPKSLKSQFKTNEDIDYERRGLHAEEAGEENRNNENERPPYNESSSSSPLDILMSLLRPWSSLGMDKENNEYQRIILRTEDSKLSENPPSHRRHYTNTLRKHERNHFSGIRQSAHSRKSGFGSGNVTEIDDEVLSLIELSKNKRPSLYLRV